MRRNEKIVNYVLEKDFKETYGVTNDSCPICKEKFIVPCNVMVIGNIAYDLECYTKLMRAEFQVK